MSYLSDIDTPTIDAMGREWARKLNSAVGLLEHKRMEVQKLELQIDTSKRLLADLRAERNRRDRNHDSAA